MMQFYLYFKALHIIGFVSWFAGLFYLVRIFVYRAEANDKPEPLRSEFTKEFDQMAKRVYKIIMNPAMIITWTFGLTMLIANPAILNQSWIKVKLVLLLLLTAYHVYCKGIIKSKARFTSFQFRLLNELPSLFLVAIVLLAVLKDTLNFLYLFLGILLFGLIIFAVAKAYKRYRGRSK